MGFITVKVSKNVNKNVIGYSSFTVHNKKMLKNVLNVLNVNVFLSLQVFTRKRNVRR